MSNNVKTLNTVSRDCGVGRNVGLVSKIEQRLDGLKVTLPQVPMIVGAVGAALIALDRAPKEAVADQAAPEPA